jgi:hypothetical protein
VKYGDYRDPLPGESSNAYWERMTKYEKEHGIDPLKGSASWPSPKMWPVPPKRGILQRILSWVRGYFGGRDEWKS